MIHIAIDLDERDRKRWEIAENLHRAELTALERDEHVAEWIRLTEQEATEAKTIGRKDVRDSGKRDHGKDKPGQSGQVFRGGRGNKSGVSQAARELNLSGKTEESRRHTARRALNVDSLTPEAKQAAIDTGLDDNRTALRACQRAGNRQRC
jgi:hypothetical protein